MSLALHSGLDRIGVAVGLRVWGFLFHLVLFSASLSAKSASISPPIHNLVQDILNRHCEAAFTPIASVEERFQFEQSPRGYFTLKGQRETTGDPQEINAASVLARYLSKDSRKFLLLTNISRQSIPGFDGVLLDKYETPLSNVSINSNMSGLSAQWLDSAFQLAKERSATYLDPVPWLRWKRHLNESMTDILVTPDQVQSSIFRRLWSLFGVHPRSPRKTIVVFDMTLHPNAKITYGAPYLQPDAFPSGTRTLTIDHANGNATLSPLIEERLKKNPMIQSLMFITSKQVLEIWIDKKHRVRTRLLTL